MRLKVGRSGGGKKLALMRKLRMKQQKKVEKKVEEDEEDFSEEEEVSDVEEPMEEATSSVPERKHKGVIVEEGATATKGDEDDESMSDEGEDDEDAQLTHKEQLSKLKETDPELFKYLQSEESDLLDFEVQDEEEEDEGEDEEEEEEGESDEDERTGTRMPKVRKDRDGRQIFDGDLYEYVEEALDQENPAYAAVRFAVNAFTACVARVGTDMAPPPWVINDQKVFDAVVRLCFRRVGDCLYKMVGTPTSEAASSGRLSFQHWKKHQSVVKQYLHGLLTFLNEIQSPSVIVSTVKSISALATLYAQFPKLCRLLVKALTRLWTRKTLECRCVAYFAMNALVKASPDNFAVLYKTCYMGFVSCSREVTSETWPLLVFMHRSFAQLSLLNPNVAYQYAFVYIRQTAIHIRNAVISNKRKDLVQSVYNWQLMQCLYMWTRVISHAHTAHDTEALRELAYPLIQIIHSTLRLFPSQRYLPLRAHCVELLLQLQASCDCFVPTLALSTELMSETVALLRSKPREVKISSQSPDLASMLKTTSQQLDSPQWRKSMVDEVFRLLVQSAHVIATQPSFHDVVLPLVHRLRGLIKGCRHPETSTQLKNLCDKLKEHSDWVRIKLSNRHIDITDELNIIGLRSTLRDHSSPLASFHQQWVRYWKMQERLLTKSDPKPEKKKEEPKKKSKKTEAKAAKKSKKDEDEEEDEDEEVKSAEKLKKKKKKYVFDARVKPDATIPDQVGELASWSDED